jgi:hypothetical protein
MSSTENKSNHDYWQSRKKIGRPKKIKSPKMLWDLACDYFSQVSNNPIVASFTVHGGEMAGKSFPSRRIRPFSWQGLDDYLFELGVIVRLEDYKSNKDGRYNEFADIITRVGNIIYNQKFEGAAVGLFKENIISRELGLVDKSSTELRVEQPLFPDVSKDNSHK